MIFAVLAENVKSRPERSTLTELVPLKSTTSPPFTSAAVESALPLSLIFHAAAFRTAVVFI